MKNKSRGKRDEQGIYHVKDDEEERQQVSVRQGSEVVGCCFVPFDKN